MRSAIWYFDFISPFAYLQLADIEALRDRLSIHPVPIVLAALLKHHENIGPAEIPRKREFTYRFVQWRAEHAGIPLRFPPAHPFNPLAALRLCIAAGSTWQAVRAIFDHLWRDGHFGDSAEQLDDVGKILGVGDVAAVIAQEDIKRALRVNTEQALAAGVFGVPTLGIDDELFWGCDATPMIEDWLADPLRFREGEYRRIANLPMAVARKR